METEINEVAEILKTVWPEWKILERLDNGSFGEVYKAVRNDLAGPIMSAIKVIQVPCSDQEAAAIRAEGYSQEQTDEYFSKIVQDYTSEIQTMVSLKGYTNIVAIDDYKIIHLEKNRQWFLFIRMELLKNVDFIGMDEAETIQLGIDICTALEVCREKSIVHRDIKPGNILVNDTGNYKLADFGVAKKMDNAAKGFSTKGTPNYMAPEVYKAMVRDTDLNAAAKADIYSLGLVLYWICNGSRLPFVPDKQILNPSDRADALTRRIQGEQLPPLKNISESLQQVIQKACAYDPNERFQSASAMKKALQSLNDHGKTEKKGKKKRTVYSAAAAVVLVIFALAYMLYHSSDSGKSEDTCHIILSVSDSFGANDYTAAKKIIKNRLDILSANRDYEMKEQNGKLDLQFPASAFSSKGVEYTLRAYITRPIRLYLMDQENHSAYAEVLPSDLAETELIRGAIPGVTASEYGIQDEMYKYLKIRLTDDYIAQNSFLFQHGRKLVFTQDMEEFPDDYYNYYTFTAEETGTFYILNDDMEDRFYNLLIYNITGTKLAEAIYFSIDPQGYAVWETNRDETWGKLQCTPGELPDITETIVWNLGENATEGAILDFSKVLKIRLDALGTPYAFGKGQEGKADIYVRTETTHLNDSIVDILGKKASVQIRYENYRFTVYPSAFQYTSEDRPLLVLSELSNNDFSCYQTINKMALDNEETFYLYVNNYPVYIIEPSDGNKRNDIVDIKALSQINNGRIYEKEMTESDRWYTGFIRAVLETSNQISQYSSPTTLFVYNSGEEETVPYAPNLYHDIISKDALEAMRTILPEVSISYMEEEGNIIVFLHLIPDDQFSEKSVSLTEKLWKFLDASPAYVNQVIFLLTDEDFTDFERTRIIISKTWNDLWSLDTKTQFIPLEKAYHYTYICSGERMNSYEKKLEEKISKSPLFSEMGENWP